MTWPVVALVVCSQRIQFNPDGAFREGFISESPYLIQLDFGVVMFLHFSFAYYINSHLHNAGISNALR